MNREVPEWATREYGGYGAPWWEAVNQCQGALVQWARLGKIETYTQLANRVTAIPWPEGAHTHQGSQIGRLRGTAAVEEWAAGRPLLSAIVVSADTQQPSYGFYDLAMQLGDLPRGASPERQERYWIEQVQGCFTEY
jgi:hypothetical protein